MVTLKPFSRNADAFSHSVQFVIHIRDHMAHNEAPKPSAHIVNINAHSAESPVPLNMPQLRLIAPQYTSLLS
jgi:hypothetical protein